jgi:hypothetical protein
MNLRRSVKFAFHLRVTQSLHSRDGDILGHEHIPYINTRKNLTTCQQDVFATGL